jgi:AraC-like DNA-binding protein
LSKSIHDLKTDIYERPDENWSVKLMADMLNISTGHLENTYKSIFGVSCMEDVIVSRITLAKTYLQNSTCSISEIISRCGYRSAEHFYRQFKM